MKPLNIKEFIELIERYESITLEEILSVESPKNPLRDVKEFLTGFGTCHCKLCAKGSGGDDYACEPCVHYYNSRNKSGVYCLSGVHRKTYEGISDARTAEELLKAYQARAKHMRSWLKKRKIEIPVTK